VSFPKILSSNPEDSSSKAVSKSISSSDSSVQKRPLAVSALPKKKSTTPIQVDENPVDPVTDAFKSLFSRFDVDKKITDIKMKEPSSLKISMAAPKVSEATEAAKETVKRKKEAEKAAAKEQAEAALKAKKEREEAKERQREEESKKKEEQAKARAAVAKARAEAAAKAQKEQEDARERQRAQDAKRKEVEVIARAKAVQQSKQENAVQQAKPGATIRLFIFFVSGDEEVATMNPPKGVPVLSKWRKNSDGSISGNISGSPAYADGDAISTSPLKGEAISGSVVTTQSGSRYVMHILFALYPRLYFVLKSLIMPFSYSLVSSAADTF
jgi:hypothetical protein